MENYESLYKKSIEHPEEFWKSEADKIKWFSPPQKILSTDEEGLYRWFEGGKINTSYLAIDYHIEQGRGDELAVIYDSPVTNTQQKFTFLQLRDEVSRFAGALSKLGVEKGDRIIIYMPMIPQALISMLACARIGAIHSVVFGGFAAHELALRIDDAEPKYIILASAGIEIDKIIPYKPIVDRAIQESHFKPQGTIIFQRSFHEAEITLGFDLDWNEIQKDVVPQTYVELDAHDPLYILYTSGTTGTPKGIVRDNGGHAVALNTSLEYIYGANAGDVFWAASDVGWVVGHSYIVYGPLIRGCCTVLYEGKPIKTPDAGKFWKVIDDHGVNVFFTAPTAIRAIKKEDNEGKLLAQYHLKSLKNIFLAGERTDVATLNWLSDMIHKPVIDHWWQTESGWPMLANMAGLGLKKVKPGSAAFPVFGFNIQILEEHGEPLGANHEGAVAIKLPLPPGCLPNLWKNTVRFKASYLEHFEGYYFSGDGGYKDDDGYFYITGRIDDIINVAGHRLSTAEMEEVIAAHNAVAECCVIGAADELKGQIPFGLVVLKAGVGINQAQIEKELVNMVRDQVGPVASFKNAMIVERLPKTRSGKILRKIIRSISDDTPYKVPSTIEDIHVLDEIKDQFSEYRKLYM
ncbi:MAG: acetate--CoA ligase [Saprospiraceae bacterium]|nr:acetate--CoA ligase [Saprospiraceae bacterium]